MKKKLVVILGSLFLAFVSAIVPVTLRGGFNRANKAYAFYNNNNTGAIVVDEIWSGNGFDKQNINKLLKLVAGNDSVSSDDMSIIESQANTKRTAYQIKNTTAAGKVNTQDIIVKVGGLNWTVTYLSEDKNGNPILTFWLSNGAQLTGKKYDTSKTFGTNGVSQWSSGYNGSNSPTVARPDNLYGTSYMRSVVLNNGGLYSSASNASTTSTYTKRSDSVFAPFTITTNDNSAIADFIVKPESIAWQESGQIIKPWSYNLSNENWSKTTPNTGFYNANYNYASKAESDVWKDDYLWLPSVSEIGWSGENQGLWGTSYNQRYNETYFWMRSAHSSDARYPVVIYNNNISNTNLAANYAVRPAFHLNLNKVVEHLVGEDGNIYELWDSETQEIDKENLNKLYSYLTGNVNATYEDVLTLAQQKKNASDFYAVSMPGKKVSTDIKVTLGGLDWTATYLSTDKNGNAILTMWLDYASTNYYYNNGFSPANGTSYAYPDNMYGASRIRSVELNNGGFYSTSNNAGNYSYRAQQKSNPYAQVTMKLVEGRNLVDYLVTPEYVSWQQSGQSSQSILGYKTSNENWSKDESDTGFYSNSYAYNFAKRTDSDAWKKDTIWLPSLTEVGVNNSNNGIWKTTNKQRTSATNSWLRTAHIYDMRNNYYLYVNGADSTYAQAYCNVSYGVRPALHFNLNVDSVENPEPVTPKDDSTYVKVNELWDEDNNKIDSNNFEELMQYIMGSETYTYNGILNTAKATKNSSNFRSNTINGKTSSQDIVVTLGGLEWTVTYLSTSTYGEPILTLWLNDSSLLNNGNYDTTKTFNENGLTSWNNGAIPHDSVQAGYPDNLYGSSYMNSVVLNNGGIYLTTTHSLATANYVKRADSIFAPFTMQDSNKRTIADFIVTPNLVSWQTTGQLAKTLFGTTYNFSNENLGSVGNTGFFTNIYPGGTYYNYQSKSYNNTWGARNLWLPSLCETGFGSNSNNGIWALSDAQRTNVTDYWLRTSADMNGYESCYLTANGENYDAEPINYENAVRPALHFNLNMAYASAVVTERDESGYVKVDELWNSETQKMSDVNLDTLIKYLTGNDKGGYSDLLKLAKETRNASDFRSTAISGKTSSQDIILTLGGLEWTSTYLSTDKNGNVVLTLWLASDYQSAWEGVHYKDGVLSELSNNTLQSKYSSWVGTAVTQYPNSMYGTSYLRSIVLNNGGTYASNATTANYVKKNSNSIFANFTMPVSGQYNDITDFLVTPLNITWQENQSFFNYYGQGNDYSNEAWMFNFPSTNFVANTSYGDKVGNDNWKNDYLWLPSYSEIATIGDKSFWGLSDNQLYTYNEEFYLRTYANTANYVYAYNGLLNQAVTHHLFTQGSIRPAMHLNLTAIIESLNDSSSSDGSIIYLDTENGNDLFNGTSYLKPVKTIEKAEELVSRNGVIEIMNKVTVLDDVTLGKNKFYTLKRWEGAEYVTGYWGTLLQVGDYKDSSNKNFANLTLNVVVNGNDTTNILNLNDIYKLGIVGIDVNYGNLIFDKNSGIEGFNNKLYTHIVYLRNEESKVTINECNFFAKNNFGTNIIYAENNASKIIINGGTFENNTQQYMGEDNFASLIYGGNITIKNAKFVNNFVLNDDIDANNSVIKLNENGVLNIEDCVFISNLGTLGGIICAENNANILIKNSQFINNNVVSAGGVIYLSGNNVLDINNSIFTGNSAKAGGAIFGLNGNEIKIEDSIFSENSALDSYVIGETEYFGGGAILLKANGNVVKITFTDFNNNIANNGNGGAINIDGSNVKFGILNCNFYGNSAKNSGGSLYVNDEATNSSNKIEINKCNFEKSVATENGGAVYLTDNISADIYNCFFKNNSVTSSTQGLGGAVRGGVSYNNTFENNSSAYLGGALYRVDSFNSTFIDNSAVEGGAMYGGAVVNCTFVGNSATKFGGAVYNPTSVSKSAFSSNTAGVLGVNSEVSKGLGGAIYNTIGLDSLINCIFTNNSATGFGGAVYNSVEDEEKQTLSIIDSEFTFNYAESGSAIYNNGKLELLLKGEVTITNNVTSKFGAIYFAGSETNSGSAIIVGDKTKVNNIYIYNNFTANNVSELEKDKNGNLIGDVANNLYIDFEVGGDVNFTLASNLVGGSKVGVTINNFVNDLRVKEGTTNEYYLINYLTTTDILTLATKAAFVSDDLDNVEFYSETIYNGANKTGLGIFIKIIDETSRTITYTASDYYGGYDGNEHSVEIKVFVPTNNYTIYYSTEENGEYSTTPITVRDAGESVTVWFYIEATGFTRTNKDKRNVAIDKMNIFYDNADIDINLWFNQNITTNGTNVNRFVTTGIIDEDGNAVACDFILYASANTIVDLSNTTKGYTLDIIPKNTEKYKSITGVSVYPSVTYDNLYYSNGFFYPTEEELKEAENSAYKASISTFDINTMLPFLVDMGVVFFANTYNVTATLNLNVESRVEFRRYNFLGSIFETSFSGKLNITTSLDGNLTFRGEENSANNSTAKASIVNSGSLEINGSVIFTGFWNYNTTSQGGAINSSGTLYLENVNINNCVSVTSGGGIIAGNKTTIVNCRIENCKAQNGGGLYVLGKVELQNVDIVGNFGLNNSTADTKAVRGGGVYIAGTSSEVTIISSRINYNGFSYITSYAQGGGIYIESGNVVIEDSDISYNNSYYGGGLYISATSNVTGSNLRIESNTLQNGTTAQVNMGAGVFIDERATFTLISGLIRSNGTNRNSTTHNINGIGVFNNGNFNFATNGDTTSQITLNSDRVSTYYGGGIVNNGVINLYGGYISQNFTARGDSNCGNGVFGIGGTTLITGTTYFQGENSLLNVLDNWENFNDPENKKYQFVIDIQGNRKELLNPVIVEADSNFAPTWDEWLYISNKIEITPNLGVSIKDGSTRTLSFDVEKNEYKIYYKTPMAAGTGVYYFNPSTGNDLNDGLSVNTALKTWNGILEKTLPGDTIYIGATWSITDYMDIDGEGRVLKKLKTWAGNMIQISGTYNPNVSIKNLILDGNKLKDGDIAEGSWSTYLSGGYQINIVASCTLNLKNVVFRNNSYATGVLRTAVSNGDLTINIVECEFLDNTSYSNGNWSSCISIDNANTNFEMNLFGCEFRRNQRIVTSYYYQTGTCLILRGSSSTSKITKVNFENCLMDNNEVYNSSNYTTYSKLVLFDLTSFGENEKAYFTFNNCDITNNKDRTVLNKGQNGNEGSGLYVYSPNAYVEFNLIDVNYSNNFSFRNAVRFYGSAGKNIGKFNVENCNFIGNEYFNTMIFVYNKVETVISNCVFDQQLESWLIYFDSPTGCDITITDCEIYNTNSAIYTHNGARNVFLRNIKYVNSSIGELSQTPTITGTLYLENIYAKGCQRIANAANIAGGVVARNIYIEDCYDGFYFNTGVKDIEMENITIKNVIRYGIYSNATWNAPRSIFAQNVKIQSVKNNNALYLRYSNFYGENVKIDDAYIAIDFMGGSLCNVDINSSYIGMYVYNDTNSENHIENVTINNSRLNGIEYLYYTESRRLNLFVNVKISNSYRYGFLDTTNRYSNNLVFENCIFETGQYGYYRWYSSYYNYNYIDQTTFINCIFRKNYYDGIFCGVNYSNSYNTATTYNFVNCLSEDNGRFGFYFNRANTYSSNYPVFNIDKNTVVRNNLIGLYIAGEGSQPWFVLKGGQFVNNATYGVFANGVLLTVFPSEPGSVVVKNNGIGEYGDKTYNDIYAPRYYLRGEFDIESLVCGTTTNGIYINASIADAKPVKVSVMGNQTTGTIVAQGNSYTPTAEDYNKLVSTNWSFTINASSQLVLGSVSSDVYTGTNIFYFDPQRTVLGSGATPTDPITNWDILVEKINEDSIVYVMSSFTVSKNIDGKNATFKFYINPTLTNPAYYFANGMFKVITGNVKISNIRIDGNSNVNGFLSPPIGGMWPSTITSLKLDVEGAIAYINGNSTLTVENMYINNLWCKNAFRLESGENRLIVKDSLFEHLYVETNGLIYSQGTYVEINNSEIRYIDTQFVAYCNNQSNIQLKIVNSNFYNLNQGFWFNGSKIAVDNVRFEFVETYTIYIDNATDATSYISNCIAEFVSWFLRVQASALPSFVNLTNIEVNYAYSYGFYLSNVASLKTITGDNIIVKNTKYAFDFWQHCKIELSNYQAIDCTYGMGYNNDAGNSYKQTPNVNIKLTGSKFIGNEYGFYYYYYTNTAYILNLEIIDSIFEDSTKCAIYSRYYTYSNYPERPHTITLRNVEIYNCRIGVNVDSCSLYMYDCKIKGTTVEQSIYYNTFFGTLLHMENCDISSTKATYAVHIAGGQYSTAWSKNVYIYNCNFSNNKYGSFKSDTGSVNIYVTNSVFDKTSGSPINGYQHSSICTDTTCLIYLSGKVIIDAAVYIAPNNYNLRINDNLEAGSNIRIFLNRGGASANYVAYATDVSWITSSIQYIHADGWDVYQDGNYVRLQASPYMPIKGDGFEEGATALYFDPVNGSDRYHGQSPNYPVKTWLRVEELNIHNLPIYLMSEWKFTESCKIDGHGWTLLRYFSRSENASYEGTLINISGENTIVTLSSLYINGNRTGLDIGVNNTGVIVNSTSSSIVAEANTTLIMQNCKVTNFFYTEGCSIMDISGSFLAENCEFSELALRTGNNSSNLNFNGMGEEISFYRCEFKLSTSSSNANTNVKVINIENSNNTINFDYCNFNNLSTFVGSEEDGIIYVSATDSVLYITNCYMGLNNSNSGRPVRSAIKVVSPSCETYIINCKFVETFNTSQFTNAKYNGGAIYVDSNSIIEIRGCEFENCFAENGAGIYITSSSGCDNLEIILTDLVFKNCYVGNGFGSAICIETQENAGGKLDIDGISGYYNFGNSAVHINMNSAEIKISNLELDGSNFSNTSVATNSGGIYVVSKNDSSIVLDNVSLKNNAANSGAMSHIESDGEDSSIRISSLQISGGTSSNILFNIKGGNVTLSNSNFSYNNAFSIIGFEDNKFVKVTALNFQNNVNGYAIYSTSSVAGTHNLSDIRIINNSSSGIYYGGHNQLDSVVTLDNIRVENNLNMQAGITIATSKGLITNSVVKNNKLKGSAIGGFNADLTINHTDILFNELVEEGREFDASVFISRGVDMFVEMPKDTQYSSGAVSIIGGKANLQNINVKGNISAGFGGGIVSVAPIKIADSNISNNIANNFGGGLVVTMDAEITNTTIENNTATSNGGGIWFGALLKLTNVKLVGNKATNGSAIYSFGDKASMDIANTSIKQNTTLNDGGVYFVNDRGSVELRDVNFVGNTGYGKGAALYLNSLTFVERNIVFSGNNIYGTLINFENVANFEMSDFVVSGNYGYGENATLFSFTTAQGNSSRMLFRDGRIYGNKMEFNASVVIDDGLYIRMTNVEVTGNSNLYSGADLTTDNGKGGAIFVKNGTLVLEDGLAVDNWAEYGAWLFIGPKGKAVISSQEISNISTDADTTINGVIYVEKNGELELHNCKILGISLGSLKGAVNNNGHTIIVDSAIYDNNTANSIIYNGKTGVISLEGVDVYSNSSTNGGAIYNKGVINFVSGKIRDNSASLGGAVYNEGDFTLSGGEIENNTATSGGAIYNKGKIILSSGRIASNTASTSGAGVYNDKDASLIMQGGEITLNSKTETGTSILGSGIANYGSLYIYGGTLSSNGGEETGNGGGLYAGSDSYNYIENAKIENNSASAVSSGANIYLSANAYALIKNSVITSGRESSSNAVMDIFATNATLILNSVTLNSSANSGSLRADNSNVTITNSYITNLKPNIDGVSFYIQGGNLVLENTTISKTSNSISGVIYLDNVITFNMTGSSLIENNTRAIYVDVSKVATQVNIKHSLFSANSVTGNGGALLIKGSASTKVNANILIENTTFTSNIASENGGAIYLGTALGVVVELYDSTLGGFVDTNNNGIYDDFDSMLGNFAKVGGAIYIESENPASLVLKGEVTITYNASSSAGGGIYYAFNGETDYDNSIYGLSLQSGAIITIKNNYTNSTQTSVSTRDENNLHLSKDSNKGILVAELSLESSIGLTIDNAEDALTVVTTYKTDIPVTTIDINVFSYDDSYNYSLKLDALKNAIVLVAAPDNNQELIVHISDKVYTMDGKPKTVTAEDFTVYNCRDYSIYFAESEDGEYSLTAPSYVEIKDYTIYYKIVDNSNLDKFVTGRINFRITGRILSIVEAPTAYINAGDRLSLARFENGIVKSGNLVVSGTWSFENGNTIPSDVNTRYVLKFTPSDSALYENTVSVLVAPTIAFSKVYFYNDRFYNDAEHTSFTGISTLSNMVSALKDGGEIFFMSSYTVGANGVLEETIITNKKIFLYRHSSLTNAPIIVIPNNSNIVRFTLGGGTGSIYITSNGSVSASATEPLFSNSGILSINNNVYISNITNTGGGPSVARNYEGATLNLNGCSIFNTYVNINTALLTGGSIYNEGNLIINGGDYRLNYSTYGNGGFIFNTGSVTINSGLFARNYTLNGSGGCIYTKGGSVVFNGGDFIGNSANYGGVICIDEQGDAIINGANFYSNVANVDGASIFTILGNVIQNGGDFKFNVNLALKNNTNTKTENNGSNLIKYVILVLSIVSVLLTFVYVSVKKNKNNFLN